MTNRTDDRADTRLPVTAEVGSEGGSYADPTTQVATFGNEGQGLVNVDHPSNDSHGYALEHGSDGVTHGTDSTPIMHRYPTDPPPSAPARRPGLNWRAATVGAAAGAAGAALAMALRRRRRS
jgi:hypothetical protein